MPEFADHWQEMDDDAASSTIAWFKTGAKCVTTTDDETRGEQVLIWQGVETNDGQDIHVPSHHTQTESVPDDAEYVIECLNENGNLTNEYFESSYEDALEVARLLTRGTIPRKSPAE